MAALWAAFPSTSPGMHLHCVHVVHRSQVCLCQAQGNAGTTRRPTRSAIKAPKALELPGPTTGIGLSRVRCLGSDSGSSLGTWVQHHRQRGRGQVTSAVEKFGEHKTDHSGVLSRISVLFGE